MDEDGFDPEVDWTCPDCLSFSCDGFCRDDDLMFDADMLDWE